MTLPKNSAILAAVSAIAATPAFAHGSHLPAAAAVHGPLHQLMILGGGIGASVIAYLAVRAIQKQRSADTTQTNQ